MPPKLIPTGVAARDLGCGIKASTSNPTPVVAHRVQLVHRRLGTTWPDPYDFPSMHEHCCDGWAANARGELVANRQRRYLVALHIRTGWADVRLKAATNMPNYSCPRVARPPADEVYTLMLARNFANLTHPAEGFPSLSMLVDSVARTARADLGGAANWSLFVASDAPATREFAVWCSVLMAEPQRRLCRNDASCGNVVSYRYARSLGIEAAHTHGVVGHNNVWTDASERNGFGRRGARHAAETAVVDLLMLSHADVMVAVNSGSTFPKASKMINPCRGHRSHGWVLHHRPFAGPISRALFRAGDAHAAGDAAARPDCVRDCFAADPDSAAMRAIPSTMPLIRAKHIGGGAIAYHFNATCRQACSCFLRDAFEHHNNSQLPRVRKAHLGLGEWR
jgi:hypothetical protein